MDPPFEVPLVDSYDYRLVELSNGIQALLIHDSEADKAAAACDVCMVFCTIYVVFL